MNCQFLRIQYSHLPNYITIFSILQCVGLIQAPKTVHMLRKIIAVPNLSVPLFCTAKFPKVWILPVLLFTSPWRDLTLPYLFSVNLETDLEAWSNKSSMSLLQNNFIGSAAYTYKESMSCLRVSVFVMCSIYYCLDP